MAAFLFKSIVKLWTVLPFKKELSKIVKANTKIKEKLYRDLRYVGVMEIENKESSFCIYNPGYTTIENELFWNGLDGWEPISMDIWRKLSKESETILDIGANTGLYSIVAASINSNARIFAFEPVKRTAELFTQNIKLNNYKNIVFSPKAVSKISGKSIFYDVDTEYQYSASLNEKMFLGVRNKIEYEVDIIALDDIGEFKNKKIDLVKLDVELHEVEAFRGMLNIVKRDKPTFLIEILDDLIGESIEQMIEGLGYLYFNIDEKNKPKRCLTLKKKDSYNYLLCLEETAKTIGLDMSLK